MLKQKYDNFIELFHNLNTNFHQLSTKQKQTKFQALVEARKEFCDSLWSEQPDFLKVNPPSGNIETAAQNQYGTVNTLFYYWQFIIKHNAPHPAPNANEGIYALAEMQHELMLEVETASIQKTNPKLYQEFATSLDGLIQYTYQTKNLKAATNTAQSSSHSLFIELTAANTKISLIMWLWETVTAMFVTSNHDSSEDANYWLNLISIIFGIVVTTKYLYDFVKEKCPWHNIPGGKTKAIKPHLISAKMFRHLISKNQDSIQSAMQAYIDAADLLKQNCANQGSIIPLATNMLRLFGVSGLTAWLNNRLLPAPFLLGMRNYVSQKIWNFFAPKPSETEHPFKAELDVIKNLKL